MIKRSALISILSVFFHDPGFNNPNFIACVDKLTRRWMTGIIGIVTANKPDTAYSYRSKVAGQPDSGPDDPAVYSIVVVCSGSSGCMKKNGYGTRRQIANRNRKIIIGSGGISGASLLHV